MVEPWDGWLVEFLNGEKNQEMRDIASGLLTVPLKVSSFLHLLSHHSSRCGAICWMGHVNNSGYAFSSSKTHSGNRAKCPKSEYIFVVFRMKSFVDEMKEWSEEKTEESKDRAGKKVLFQRLCRNIGAKKCVKSQQLFKKILFLLMMIS